MKGFSASNGAYITRTGETGQYLEVSAPGCYEYLGDIAEAALREYFQAEEDERLHRWRDPQRPYLLVYQASEGAVVVFHEDMPHLSNEFYRDHFHSVEGPLTTSLRLAARAYFEAHPEVQPWHDAKPGEVWLLTIRGEEVPAIRGDVVDFTTTKPGDTAVPFNSDKITAGRRIWPEATS